MNFWRFWEGVKKPADQWRRAGKPEWPAIMQLSMSRKSALRLLRDIAAGLDTEGTHDVELTLVGKLERSD